MGFHMGIAGQQGDFVRQYASGTSAQRSAAPSRSRIAFGTAGAALIALLSLAVAGASVAQEPQPVRLNWQQGAGTAPIGSDLSEIDLDESFVYLDGTGTRMLMELTENPLTGREVATVAPASDQEQWFLVFEYDESGYVADDERDDLDPYAMLESIREGTEASNKERRKRGWDTLSIVGWHEPPHYDLRTNNLSWAIIGESAGDRSMNRIVKLLGRRGVMTATLVASPEEFPIAMAQVDALLEGYRYRSGNTYAEYVPGTDKLAKYGLTALVVGGAGAVLMKSGLLARFWKPIAAALAALGVGVKRFFFSGRSAKHDPEKPIG